MATEVIRIDVKAYETLKKLGELSGLEMKSIIDEWLFEISKVLDDFENPRRISLMSARNLGRDRNLVITYLSKMVTTSFSVGNEVSDKEAEKKAKVKAK